MYKVDPPGPGDHLAMHLAIDGWALFREGDEAKLQATAEEKRKAAADEARKEAQKQASKRNREVRIGVGKEWKNLARRREGVELDQLRDGVLLILWEPESFLSRIGLSVLKACCLCLDRHTISYGPERQFRKRHGMFP